MPVLREGIDETLAYYAFLADVGGLTAATSWSSIM
jgi:hypothetical protein